MAHELGHTSTLPGEHHFTGAWSTSVIAERLPSQARTVSQARALIPRQSRKHSEDGDSVVNVRGVPTQKLMRALGRAIVMRDAAVGSPEGRQGGV